MADFPSRLDLYAIGRDYVVQRATKIDPTQVDVQGSDINVFVGSTSGIAYSIVLQLAYAVNRLLLDGAQGDDLDRYAWDRYQLTRKGASPALGPIRVYRTSATAGAGSIPIGTKLKTNQGFDYITITTINFAAAGLSATGSVRAAQAGKSTQVGKNQIRKFASPGSLFDTTLQVNNDGPTAGGEEREDDDTFKSRIRDFWNTARRGTLGAIEFGALQVQGVVSASAVEAITTDGFPARVVNLYIADSSGVASDALAAQVRANLLDFRAGGIAVIIYTSLPQIVDISLKLSFQAGVATDSLTEIVRSAIVEFVNSLPVNAPLSKADLASILSRYKQDGLIVSQGSIVTPVGDLIPAPGATLRTTPANVTIL